MHRTLGLQILSRQTTPALYDRHHHKAGDASFNIIAQTGL